MNPDTPPMNTPEPVRIDRRAAIKWMMAAGAGAALLGPRSLLGAPGTAPAHGYGTDPATTKPYSPGDIWPLVLSGAQRREVAALSDVILPAEGGAPSASSVGVTDFIDEWASAPYPDNVEDGRVITAGLAWLEAESVRRHGAVFADLGDAQRLGLCEEMSKDAPEGSAHEAISKFFRLFRNLVCTGYYSTPVGMKDLGYVGNVPLARFEGPPPELVAKLGLADEVRW